MLTLAGQLPSPFVRKICIVLAEKRIDFQMRIDGPSRPDSRIPEYNPLGKIPVLLLEDSEPLFDSRVIVEYVEGIKPDPRLIPEGFAERIQVRRWEALADGTCDAAVAITAENRRPENERSPSFIRKQIGKLERAIAEMARLLGNRPHCSGSAISLADLAAGVALAYVDYRIPELSWRSEHAPLAHFSDALQERSSFRRTRNDPSRLAPDPD
jgi:glutathione S-transferase